jgi:hypothetical protein
MSTGVRGIDGGIASIWREAVFIVKTLVTIRENVLAELPMGHRDKELLCKVNNSLLQLISLHDLLNQE